ncbi:MAG: ChbG/HpnK family deacetylase, partial [Planctomycetes bacterium]|nr:ChbG/HpnK family deacetylase [Planctomycetota bacterium]
MKRLIVNADDLGLSGPVNQGIFQAAKEGCVRSATALSRAPAFQEGIDLLGSLDQVGIGIHLNLTGCWEAPDREAPPGFFKGNPKSLLKACLTGAVDLDFAESYLRKQIEAFLNTGLIPTHFDSHHHVHVFPGIAPLVTRIAKSYGI